MISFSPVVAAVRAIPGAQTGYRNLAFPEGHGI